jgi:hypothetical protein
MAMARTRYIGSNRAREGGFSATPKQDFTAHVTGGDWIHLASQITVTNPYYGNVQAELDAIIASLSILPDVVFNHGASINNAIPIFSGSTGKLLTEPFFATTLNPIFGDLVFPTGTSYNAISVQPANTSSQGQPFIITAQNNDGGQGGELALCCGFNAISGLYDADISLLATRLVFIMTFRILK